MKINVGKAKPVTQARAGDIASVDDDYFLIGIWGRSYGSRNKYYFVSLTMANMAWVKSCDLIEYLESIKAVVYDGSRSKLDLVIKEPEVDHD